jgi:signal transduction histidine kinase
MGEVVLSDLDKSDVVATAARASIHRRFAASYVHDVRGTLQALFSALELLGRSAQSGNPARIEKAYELARRAMSNHEKSTVDVVSALAQESSEPVATDLGGLVVEVAHFLRNDAATKGVKLVGAPAEVFVTAPRAELRTLLVGLTAAAIDTTPPGQELHASAARDGHTAVVTLDSSAGYGEFRQRDATRSADEHVNMHDLTFRFAEDFLAVHGGKLIAEPGADRRGSLRLYYPLSLADTRASATAK